MHLRKVQIQVSLRGLPRLTTVETFRYLSIFCMSTKDNSVQFFGSLFDNLDFIDPCLSADFLDIIHYGGAVNPLLPENRSFIHCLFSYLFFSRISVCLEYMKRYSPMLILNAFNLAEES